MRSDFKIRSARALGLALLVVLPYPIACGGTGEDAQAQSSAADSVLASILQSAAENKPEPPARSTSPRLSTQDQAQRPLQVQEMGYNFGPADAPIKVLEFSDFGCGYCRRFHAEIFPVLKETYMDGEYVEWKFIPHVIGMFPNAMEAATTAECAGEQEMFYPMQTRLFAEQGAWKNKDDPYAFFADLAADEGLDVERLKSCVEGGWRDNNLRNNIRLGQQAGARGTPFFIIDGRPLGGSLPLEDFRAILDAALIQRGVTPPPR